MDTYEGNDYYKRQQFIRNLAESVVTLHNTLLATEPCDDEDLPVLNAEGIVQFYIDDMDWGFTLPSWWNADEDYVKLIADVADFLSPSPCVQINSCNYCGTLFRVTEATLAQHMAETDEAYPEEAPVSREDALISLEYCPECSG